MIARRGNRGNGRLTRRAEKRLISRAQSGDERAARELVQAYKDRLFAFVWRMIRDHHEAEEVCQETFLRAFGALDTFSFEYRFSTWLFTIGYRQCLNWIRRRRTTGGDGDLSNVAAEGLDVGDQVAQTEAARRLKAKIWEAVDELSTPQRATTILFYREGMSCQDISESLDIPVATVKSHLHRARARLRTLLAPLADDSFRLEALRQSAS